jgi:protein-S-isoprenylcysteine O-methyltransferase Ste14
MSETPFRIALVAILVAVLSVVRYYRWRAAQSRERISRAGEGRSLFLAIRFSGLVMFLSLLLYLIWPPSMAWSSLALPAWLRWSGLAFGIASCWWMWWALSNLDRNITDTVFVRENARLVTSGPYAYVRHPMYVGIVLLIIAVSLLAANWFLLLTGLVTFTLLAIRSPIEERALEARFGDEYRAYVARTGKFLPRWGKAR